MRPAFGHPVVNRAVQDFVERFSVTEIAEFCRAMAWQVKKSLGRVITLCMTNNIIIQAAIAVLAIKVAVVIATVTGPVVVFGAVGAGVAAGAYLRGR